MGFGCNCLLVGFWDCESGYVYFCCGYGWFGDCVGFLCLLFEMGCVVVIDFDIVEYGGIEYWSDDVMS